MNKIWETCSGLLRLTWQNVLNPFSRLHTMLEISPENCSSFSNSLIMSESINIYLVDTYVLIAEKPLLESCDVSCSMSEKGYCCSTMSVYSLVTRVAYIMYSMCAALNLSTLLLLVALPFITLTSHFQFIFFISRPVANTMSSSLALKLQVLGLSL